MKMSFSGDESFSMFCEICVCVCVCVLTMGKEFYFSRTFAEVTIC